MMIYRINRVIGKGYVVEKCTATTIIAIQTCETYVIALAVRNALINSDRLRNVDCFAGALTESVTKG